VLRIIHKKHLNLAAFLIVASFLMTLISFYLIITVTNKKQIVSTQAVRASVPLKNYTVNYPVFRSPGIDAYLSEFTKQEIDTFQKKLGSEKHDPRNHLAITYQLTHQGNRTASITFHKKEQLENKPEQTSRLTMTFDLATQKLLTLADMLQLESDHLFVKLLHDYFKQHPETNVSFPKLVGLLEVRLADIAAFRLSNDSLFIYLDPHDPAAQNASPVEIKKSILGSMLREEYRRDEEGAADKSEHPAYQILTPPPDGQIIDPSQKMLALTFDDGPSHMTPGLLNTLRQYEAGATFFVLGYSVQEHAATLRRMIAEGSEIGNHSWGHTNLRLLSLPQLEHQIGDPQRLIQSVTGGYLPRLMRPPYGATNPAVAAFLQQKGLVTALWNVDTFDWRDRNTDLIYQRIMDSAGDNRVILLHDIHPTSVQAAQRAIPALKAQGYQLVTMSQLDHYR
jgi:peptidoglycan/xylan/chitin deacetylase (PgdA/CDA1 family)